MSKGGSFVQKDYFCYMSILRLVAEFFLFYILYKLIFDFVIPVYQSTKKIRKQFGEMQDKMQNDARAYQGQQNSAQPKPAPQKEGDYIEFEEIKPS